MRIKPFIKAKAAFLLLVFSLNTIIGFACAAGLNMGFNSKHHHHDDDDLFSSEIIHTPAHFATHEEQSNKIFKSEEDDNCCTHQVVVLSQSDKLLTHLDSIKIDTPVILVLTNSLYQFCLAHPIKMSRQIRVFRPVFSNTTDIRVSIRSFQI